MSFSPRNQVITTSDAQDVVLFEKEALLKGLVRKVAPASTSKILQLSEQMINEIVFESDVDGVRYCLIRCRPKSKNQINLSPREQTIAKLVAQGLHNKSIGQLLNISPWTVATHLRRIFVKLGVTSRTAMIARLLEENLLYG